MSRSMETAEAFSALQSWYAGQCNGDWEHTYGLRIGNIDNPGWSVEIDLIDTDLYETEFGKVDIQRADEDDWLSCWVSEGKFCGACGPLNLTEVVQIFSDWARENT